MRCLRIFGAYSYRWPRRHSTVMMIASLIVVLTVIFQLYAYRHYSHNHRTPNTGDFNYMPGAFLRNKQPNENRSYCQFNYGLPHEFKQGTFFVHPSPESGTKSPYRIIYNAIIGRAYDNVSKHDSVTYVTQATPEFIYHVVEIARYWDGPISLAVYVPDYDLDISMQIMNHLCHCYAGMSKVSLHLFFPRQNPPKLIRQPLILPTEPPTLTNITYEELLKIKIEKYKNLNKKNRAAYIEAARKNKIQRMMVRIPTKRTAAPYLTFNDCTGSQSFDIQTYRREFNMIYPINVGRNAARNASKTNYFIVSDIEMIPSEGLSSKFVTMVRKLMGDKKRDEGCVFAKTVFVVPLFEVEKGEEIPRDKETLVDMVANNRAMYFHQKTCSHCQRFPGILAWLKRSPTKVLEPMMTARREYPFHRWEPLYFGTHKEPWYSEMLSWEGQQDKMTQMMELCLLQYRFVVLDGGFMVHRPERFKILPRDYNYPLYKRSSLCNRYRYGAIILYFREKYKKYADAERNSTCKRCYLMYGFKQMLELCLQEYRMVILDGGFLCHAAAAAKSKFRHKRAEKVNNQRYTKIIEWLKTSYPERQECKVDWGC